MSGPLQGAVDKAVKERSKVSTLREPSNMLIPHMVKKTQQKTSPSPTSPSGAYRLLTFTAKLRDVSTLTLSHHSPTLRTPLWSGF